MFKIFTLSLLLLTIQARGTDPEATKLAGEVREIFQAKCVDCHGAQLTRPKGKFGYILDLQKVADNPDYVERGHPEDSDLYQQVFDEDMPGEDAKVPPLTKAEKESVRRWIVLGAVAAVGELAPAAVPPERVLPFWPRTLRWIGHFHPVSSHFPVALMFVAVFVEGLAWWTRREAYLPMVRLLVVLAAVGALATAGLGWINAWFANYTGDAAPILAWHRWLGTGAAVWAAVCGGLVVLTNCEEGSKPRQQLRGALLLGALLVGVTGFLGSALIYGLDHYAW